MKNLKRALSFALASVMLIGMMVVGAGAAVEDFSDKADIVNKEAVDTLTALNVIAGKEDGSFYAPKDTLTRAEAAKMIVYILHGGKAPTIGTKEVPTFSDIKGNWAEAYIEYCASTGILAGKGDGTFGPNDKLTGSAFAKMLLVAIGFDATVFSLTGNNWEINTNVEANKIDLYDEIETIDPSAVINRDNAAQMLYNALFCGIMEKGYNYNLSTGALSNGYEFDKTTDLFAEKFNGKKEYGYITNVDWDEVKDEYIYTLTNTATFGGATIATTDDGLTITSIKSKVDYSALFGQKVAVVYKDADTDVLYGIYAEDSTVLATGAVGSITDVDGNAVAHDDVKIKLGGVEVKLTADVDTIPVYNFNVAAVDDAGANDSTVFVIGANVYSNVTAIDNTGDAKADVLVVFPATAQKVTYVGTNSITAGTNYAYNKDEAYYTASAVNYVFPEGIAKNDYVLIPGYGVDSATREITQIDTVEGKVVGWKTNDAQIGDVWYKKNGHTIDLDSTYEIAAVNKYVVGAKEIEASSKDIAMVIAADPASALYGIKAKVMFSDGTTDIIEISKVNAVSVDNGNANKDEITDNFGVGATIAVGDLITYVKKDTGKYEIKELAATNLAGYDEYIASYTDYNAAVSNGNPAHLDSTNDYRIADDAVIFVQYGTNSDKYTVVTGAELKGYNTMSGATGEILMDDVNGINSAKVASLKITSDTFSKSTIYGYVLTTPYKTKSGTTDVWAYDVWTVNGKVSVLDDNTTVPAKRDVITYVTNNNGTVTSSSVAEVAVAVTGYSESDKLVHMHQASGAVYGSANGTKILDKTKILYVDTKNAAGADGGSIATAQATANGGYYENALAFYSSSELKLLVIDVSNNLYYSSAGDHAIGYSVAGFAQDTLDDNGITVKVEANKTAAVLGETVTFTVTVSGAASGTTADGIVIAGVTVNGGAELDLDGATPVAGSGITNAIVNTSNTIRIVPAAAGPVTATYTFTGVVTGAVTFAEQ